MAKNFTGATRTLEEKRQKSPAPPADAAAHLAAVEAQIAAIGRGDYASAIACAHDDVALDIFAPPEFHWINRARGTEELRRALEYNFGTVDDQRPEITTVVAQDDLVVLIGREQGRIRETGRDYDVEFVHRFSFRHGRLSSIRIIAARAA